MRAMRTLLLLLAACPAPTTSTPQTEPVPEPPARCGNGIEEAGEACDDGNILLGDGCDAACAVEAGPNETEPNDTPNAAETWSGSSITGHLLEGDVDCYALPVAQCDAVEASLVAPNCPDGVVLSLHPSPDLQTAAGSEGPDGCSVIDPAVAPGARFLPAGNTAVCVRGLLGQEVPGYTLTMSTLASDAVATGAEPDLDDDGLPDVCDPDLDGDGVPNDEDNCVDIPNGPTGAAPTPNEEGFLQHWLSLAPILDEPTTGGCRPSDTELPGGDALLTPALGDAVDDLVWTAFIVSGDRLAFLPRWGNNPPPREVYVHTYVYSATERTVTLSVGADDGVRAWVQGAEVLDVAGCQGTNADQFQGAATLNAGFNRLTLKVRDQGGGWGLLVRFLEDDGKTPVTDLELSLDPKGAWSSSQSDLDGDGLGDVCDPTPTG